MIDHPSELRRICGHDSRTVDGCVTCEAADAIERLRAALVAAMEMVKEDRDDLWFVMHSNGLDTPPFADDQALLTKLDAVIAQADAALGADR